jgi:hypothetical protein
MATVVCYEFGGFDVGMVGGRNESRHVLRRILNQDVLSALLIMFAMSDSDRK